MHINTSGTILLLLSQSETEYNSYNGLLYVIGNGVAWKPSDPCNHGNRDVKSKWWHVDDDACWILCHETSQQRKQRLDRTIINRITITINHLIIFPVNLLIHSVIL